MQKPPDPVEFVRALAPAVREAAVIARNFEGRVANQPKDGEATAVKAALTVADTSAQEAVLGPLFEHFPGVRIEAEELTGSVSRFGTVGDALVVIDPIDGTLRFYLEGGGPYGVMVGLAIAGRYEAAIVALPREGYVFEAARGEVPRWSRGDSPSRPIEISGEGRKMFVSHDLPAPAVASLEARGYEPVAACGGAISVAPLVPGVCAGLRLAQEPPSISIRGRIGAFIAESAGATVLCESGEVFPRDIRAPARALLVAERPGDLEALQEALAAVG